MSYVSDTPTSGVCCTLTSIRSRFSTGLSTVRSGAERSSARRISRRRAGAFGSGGSVSRDKTSSTGAGDLSPWPTGTDSPRAARCDAISSSGTLSSDGVLTSGDERTVAVGANETLRPLRGRTFFRSCFGSRRDRAGRRVDRDECRERDERPDADDGRSGAADVPSASAGIDTSDADSDSRDTMLDGGRGAGAGAGAGGTGGTSRVACSDSCSSCDAGSAAWSLGACRSAPRPRCFIDVCSSSSSICITRERRGIAGTFGVLS